MRIPFRTHTRCQYAATKGKEKPEMRKPDTPIARRALYLGPVLNGTVLFLRSRSGKSGQSVLLHSS